MAQRAPRFERRPELVGGVRLQERDLDIIRLTYDYRFLDSEHVALLTDSSRKTTLRRLRKLYHNGFIDRPKAQLMLWTTPRNLVYALADRGAEVLMERDGVSPEEVDSRWRRKNREVKHPFIKHTLMVSDFRCALEVALRELSLPDMDVELMFWVRESEELRDHVYYRTWWWDRRGQVRKAREAKQRTVAPDGFFGIKRAGKMMFFFLEADRGTMDHGRFLTKLKSYWAWYQQGGHRERWGIKAFRVLTVTTSERRKENLRETAREADESMKGSSMFWFTAAEEYSLSEPVRILGEIWQTPKEEVWNERFSILLE